MNVSMRNGQGRLAPGRMMGFVVAAALLAMVVAACSGGSPTPTPTSTATPTPTAATPTVEPTPTPPTHELEDLASSIVALLVAEEYEEVESHFDDTMRAQLPAAALQQVWQSVVGQVGAFQHVIRMRTTETSGYMVVVVTAQFESAPLDIQLTFDSEDRVAGLFFTPAQSAEEWTPPDYADPASFTESEIVIGSEPWQLPGTLTLPQGEGPFPAVVLVHGSGPHDRDETIGGNKVFKDLAWGLASQGIAVLRYEKRTRAYPQQAAEEIESFTPQEETVDDALAAVQALLQSERIDPSRIFVAGHSLGGMLAPAIGQQGQEVAGLIILAGLTRPLQEAVIEQVTYLAELDGTISEEEQAQIDEFQRQAQQIATLDIQPGEVVLGGARAYWEYLADYDPTAVAATLDLPMLIAQGGRDYQVTMEDHAAWQAALAGREDVEFRDYPSLNHLFIAGEGPSTPAEYQQPRHVAEELVNDIAAWILDN